MESLHEALKKVLADTFVMYFKTHSYHWNVIGPNFPQLHEFFGELYEELHGAVDPIAEHIRAARSFAPSSLDRLKELTVIEESDTIPSPEKMVTNLLSDNDKVIASLKVAFTEADSAGKDGLANFLQDRLDIHDKHGWQLRATAGIKP